jgi:NADH-quinone oxidoreductase subunit L
MGRVRADLPFISIMLLVGALALVGLPMLNGFWSKEAILDAGLSQGAGAAFLAMLVGVCLTALYAVRMLDRVVFRSPAPDSPAAPPTPHVMRWVCGALCLGTLTSWLLAEPISRAFEATLPFHQTFAVSLPDMSAEIVESAALPLALAAMGLGAVIGGLRGWAMRRWPLPGGWRRFADEGFGVEPLNRLVIRITQGTADMARRTQTGHLNWNVVGIIGGWLVVMVLIVMGGAR